jgi:hypothetical protein
MNQLLDSFRGWADRQILAGRSAKALAGILAAAGVALVAVGLALHAVELVMVIAGSLGGLSWFLAGYVVWWSALNDAWHARLNVRERWPLLLRRRVAFTAAGLWMVAMLIVGAFHDLGNAFMGAIVVVIASVFWLMVTQTPAEREALLLAWEAAQQEDVWADGSAEDAADAQGAAGNELVPRRSFFRRLLSR